MSGYFITGTDTGVGKTVAAAWLMLALDADYWKPVQAGLAGETDSEAVRRMTGFGDERFHEPPYRLRAPLSPHEAAKREGIAIDLKTIRMPATPRPLIVEGAGGVLVPLNARANMADLMAELGLPVILVARSALGTINHTLLSLEALRRRRIPVAVIMNGPRDVSNCDAISAFGNVPVIGELPVLDTIDKGALAAVAPMLPLAAAS